MYELPEVITRLNTRLNDLENRVALLERPSEVPAPLPAPALLEIPLAPAIASSSFSQAGAIFPVLGRAMLGMAGAYLLRAVAESGSFPKLAAVALAIAYAAAWLVGAARVPARLRFAGATYAATSALILAPMLWEMTLRFRFLSPATAAAVLAAFVFTASVLAWKNQLAPIVWAAWLTGAVAAIALLIATRQMVPFIAVLLLMALLSEIAADRNRWMSLRPVAAIAADFAIWSLIYIYSSPENSRPDYASVSIAALLAPACILLLIYGANVVLRTTVLQRQITIPEAAQAVLAFLLAADAVLHFAPAAGVVAFGVFCLVLAAAGYTALFTRFAGTAERRNYSAYALWSAALLLLGCSLSLQALWLAACFGVAAIAATFVGVRVSRLTLVFHGFLYALAAAFSCGWIQYAAHALAGAFPTPPLGIAWIIAACTVLAYAIGGQLRAEHWHHRIVHVLSATLAVASTATALVSALVWMMAAVITPGTSHVAVVRTLAACSLALALASLGPRWQRIELVWLAYATLALVTAKLLFEDLRQGHPEFIAASIFLYAVTLILVPRLARRASRTSPASSAEIASEADTERDTVAH
jgi:hypothetical protein